jgi:hypothetical protein
MGKPNSETVVGAQPGATSIEPAVWKTREREVDAIVSRFRNGNRRNAPSLWKIMDEMYDDRGLPR